MFRVGFPNDALTERIIRGKIKENGRQGPYTLIPSLYVRHSKDMEVPEASPDGYNGNTISPSFRNSLQPSANPRDFAPQSLFLPPALRPLDTQDKSKPFTALNFGLSVTTSLNRALYFPSFCKGNPLMDDRPFQGGPHRGN